MSIGGAIAALAVAPRSPAREFTVASTGKRATHHAKKKRRQGAARHHAPLSPDSAASAPSVLFGNQVVEPALDANPPGSAEAFPFSATTSGSTSSISVYVDSRSHASSLIAGLYSDRNGHPGSLLTAGSLSRPARGAWNQVSVNSALVQSGQTYWVALLGASGQLYFRDLSNGACSSENSSQTNLSSLPASWTSGRSYPTCSLSAYVSGTPTATSPPPPVILPPTNALPPTVSGTAVDGQTLTASQGTWLNGPASYAYQWQDCDSAGNNCSNIAGATNSSYTLADGDITHTVRTVVVASNTAGSGSATSSQTGQVAPPPVPANMAAPSVSGSAAQGQTLSTSNGSWTNNPESYRYAWQDCDSSGNNCTTIGGASSSSYVVAAGDAGHELRSMVTATNAGGSASAPSVPTAVVASTLNPPTAAFTYSPASPVTGQAVSFNAGGSTCAAAPCSYSWADDPPSGGSWPLGSGQTMTFTFSNAGTKYVNLTVTDAAGRGTRVEHDVVVTTASSGSAPTSMSPPAISGTAQQGDVLTSSAGSWSGSPASYAYQWQDCDIAGSNCANIGGATSASYSLVAGDVGHTMRAVVTASNSSGSTSATSAQTGVVAGSGGGGSAPSNTALPTVTGTAVQGSALSTSSGSWSGSPTSFTYAWQDCDSTGSNCAGISGATASSYTLVGSDVGHTIRSVVTAQNTSGATPARSAQTAAVVASLGSTGCVLNATTSNFSSQVSAAQPGQTICLASGNYGTWTGTTKAITVQAAPGATASMTDQFGSGASGFTLSGISALGGDIAGSATNITIENSTVNAEQDVETSGQVTFDNDQFPAFVGTARLWHDGGGGTVTVENSTFNNPKGLSGVADGVRCDAGTTDIYSNDFSGINDASSGGNHGDPIQIYGGTLCIIKGNFFHDMLNSATCSLGEWDGASGTVFENNVVTQTGSSNGCYDGIDLLDDHGGTVIHNVFVFGDCMPNGASTPCGGIMLGGKTSEGAGSGTVIRDNILTGISNGDGGLNSTFSEDHNLCRQSCSATGDQGPGTGDIKGTPTFVGGTNPTTYAGYALAPGSTGIGAASDGTNIGIELPTGG
jgi:hypothetical protein